MLLLIVAATLALCGLVAAILAWRGEGSILAMHDTATMSVAEVLAQHRAGRLGQLVEIVGTSECDAPLRAPYSEAFCLAYDYTVTEDKERLGYGGALSANRQHSLTHQRGQHIVGHSFDLQDSRVPRFYVRDASGRVAVDTAGARIDLLETVARFKSYTGGVANVERQIWRQEHALPLGNRVYVLATLADAGGEPVLTRHPVDPGRHFIISHHDERALLRRTRLRAYGLYLFSGLALGGALLLSAIAILR